MLYNHTDQEIIIYSTNMKPQLTIIGAGKVGTTLGVLFKLNQLCQINQVINSSLQSAKQAVKTINAGQAAILFQLAPSDIIMLACPDDKIVDVCQNIDVKPRTIVFHLSGLRSSNEIKDILGDEVFCASIHPLKSFANVDTAINTFAGTPCAIEGDLKAIEVLKPLFEAIQAKCFIIEQQDKPVWHLAAVMASNYLNGLMNLTESLYSKIGIDAQQARDIMAPLVTKTVSQILELGPAYALTGPIERGDVESVHKHLTCLKDLPQTYEKVYKVLGQWVVNSAEKKHGANEKLREIEALLEINAK